jgi:hypothetical protein
MFLIDKYKHKTNVTIHKQTINLLKKICSDKSMPNIILYGSVGAGKDYICKQMLKYMHGDEVENAKNTNYDIVGTTVNKYNVIESKYHMVIESRNNSIDKKVIHHIINPFVKRCPITRMFDGNQSYKTILFDNIDNASYYAQASLRCIVEKYSDNCRFIMKCSTTSKIILPILSRCLCIRVNKPSGNKLFKFLNYVCIKENINISFEQLHYIITKNKCSINDSLWNLDIYRHTHNIKYMPSSIADNVNMGIIIKMIFGKHINITRLKHLLYEMLISNILATDIITHLTEHALSTCMCDNNKLNILEKSIIYEHYIHHSVHEIIHIETFCIYICNLINQ